MNIEHPEQIHFSVEKGKRDSRRIALDILPVIRDELIGKKLQTIHGDVTIRLFVDVEVNKDTDKPQFGFDVTGDFGHIEFFIKQTGWGKH